MSRSATPKTGHLVLGGVAAIVLAGGGYLSLSVAEPPPEVPASVSPTTGPLDGMTFVGALGPDGKPKDIEDTFVFADGTFVSKECELRCKYPASPYFVRSDGDQMEFISETRCPYKDATIVWRGTVTGNKIEGRSTWTVRRWYWTVENTFAFAGTLEKQPAPVASSE